MAEENELVIITGPIYTNKEHKTIGKDKIVIPDAFFKMIYFVEKKVILGYIIPNEDQDKKSLDDFSVSILNIQTHINITFFILIDNPKE